MFGKVFQSVFTGSMMGLGANVFAVWTYAIVNADKEGFVELNPKLLAALIGEPEEEIEKALEILRAPDPNSRNREQEGRRLVKVSQFGHDVVSYKHYREIRDAEERRDYMREYMRERRASQSSEANGKQPLAMLAKAEAEAEAEAVKDSSPKKPGKTVPVAGFAEFWSLYRKKVDKPSALKAWNKAMTGKDAPSLEQVLQAVRDWQATLDWTKSSGQFQPYPATWLNRRGWEEPVPQVTEEATKPEDAELDDWNARMDKFFQKPGVEFNKVYDFDGKLIWDNGKVVS